MIINHNISALNTYRQMGVNQNAASSSMEKLSSGLRINKAGDDAAGLSISEKMRGQIRGLDQASRNSQDGVSMIQTAEGALGETQEMLQRMRELSVQAASDTNTADDRESLQKEITQLTEEVDRIASNTEFNNKKILNGDSGLSVGNGSIVSSASSTGDTKSGTFDVTITSLATAAQNVSAGTANATDTVNGAGKITVNGTDVNVASTDTVQDVIDKMNTISGVEAKINDSGNFEISSTDVGNNASLSISADVAGIVTSTDDWTTLVNSNGSNAAVSTLSDPDGDDISGAMVIDGNKVTLNSGDGKGLSFTAKSAGSTTVDVGVALSIQTGANSGQKISMSFNDASSSSLGISNIDVTTTKGASDAIDALDSAINNVSSERSKLGAYQNRLEHTINNLNTSSENLTAAESRIRDVDMAKEMMTMTKENIKAQAAQAMMAQANQAPQQVLQLLR
ncbi:flagellin [Anaerobacillus sp. 1_MG-2023]|uniref:flagellin N-terminal helical domain-containing protein n=1 Tax=Bacillales TaxID=1385 RepID=UPI0026E1D727|nr:flagellin [Anaerobacillus sp. 1_MG-2023]MDO6656370.1 flagellin [Anaerobacillus sp. 1_MG-2023]